MSEHLSGPKQKQAALKRIIEGLHAGRAVEEVKADFQRLIKDVDASEIAQMEQALIREGMPPEAITKLCDVHAAVFKEALEQNQRPELIPGHPLYLMSHENREVREVLTRIDEALAQDDDTTRKGGLNDDLDFLIKNLDKHYSRKENILFPYLEKKGITGPPSVMWSVDNEIRDELKQARAASVGAEFKTLYGQIKNRIQEMIFKEENILGPMLLDKLSQAEWQEIKEQMVEFGPVFSWPHGDFWPLQGVSGEVKHPLVLDGQIELDTGSLTPQQINALLTHLPVDITIVDAEDIVRYFSATSDRIFVRTGAIIGRQVQNCHPPESVHVVEKILTDFKSGKEDYAKFWLELKGRFIYIQYLALRDKEGNYLGTMEVTQDGTEIRNLTGECRLLTYDE